jgi:hypothetical protein
MICAAASTTVRSTAVAGTATVRPAARSAVATAGTAATSATAVVGATASTTTAVKAAATSTTVTTTAMLRKCGRRAKQRQRSNCSDEKLETSGPSHVCTLHPTTSQAMRAAGTPEPFYTC